MFLVDFETGNRKNDLKKKTLSLRCGLRRKDAHFLGFWVFDFTLYLKAKTWKFSFTSNFYRFGYIKHGKDFIEFQINRSDVLISHVK